MRRVTARDLQDIRARYQASMWGNISPNWGLHLMATGPGYNLSNRPGDDLKDDVCLTIAIEA